MSDPIAFSGRQEELIRLFRRGQLRRINILEGSVRSGKTWISLVLWGLWVGNMPADGSFLMAGRTLKSLERNCLQPLARLVGEACFQYSLYKKEGVLLGRRVYLESGGESRAEGRIRGLTLSGAYCDEVTLLEESFFTMLLSRLSQPGAKLIGTTNPDSPSHWFYRRFRRRAEELDMLVFPFSLEDNSFLEPGYLDALRREYTGVFYDRYILGRWVQAEGLVYPMFSPQRHVKALPEDAVPRGGPGGRGPGAEWYLSVDYGTVNPCAMGLWQLRDGVGYQAAERYYAGGENRRQKTDEEYYADLEALAGGRPIRYVVVDPSAASFIACIRRHGRFAVRKADNRVLDGIRTVGALLQAGRIQIHPSCIDTIREFGLYRWAGGGSGGEDGSLREQVVKADDHAMDQLRYFVMTVLRRSLRGRDWVTLPGAGGREPPSPARAPEEDREGEESLCSPRGEKSDGLADGLL